MKELGLIFANYGLFLTLSILLAGVQTALWLQIFGYFPPPQLWLTVFIYWCLYRTAEEATVMTVVLSLILSPLTSMPTGLFLSIHLLIMIAVIIFRRRISWSGPTYFMLVCGAATVLLPLVHLVLSHLMEPTPVSSFEFFEWIMRSLLTPLFSLALYFLYLWIDIATDKELPKEFGASL